MITSKRPSLLKEIDFSKEVPLLVLATLQAFDGDFRSILSRREDPISRQIVFALLRLQAAEGWEWLSDYAINSQRDELDEVCETHEGRTDITFELGGHHRFIWECKRLHHNGKTLYSEYRSEGVMRFITGKYSKVEAVGGMLAFVMDGNIGNAIKGVEQHLFAYKEALKILGEGFSACESPVDARLRESLHFPNRDLTISHCFLPFNVES